MLRSRGPSPKGTAPVFAAPPIIETEIFARVPDELRQHRDPRHQSGVPRDCFIEGPSFDRDGNLYITNIPYGQILQDFAARRIHPGRDL